MCAAVEPTCCNATGQIIKLKRGAVGALAATCALLVARARCRRFLNVKCKGLHRPKGCRVSSGQSKGFEFQVAAMPQKVNNGVARRDEAVVEIYSTFHSHWRLTGMGQFRSLFHRHPIQCFLFLTRYSRSRVRFIRPGSSQNKTNVFPAHRTELGGQICVVVSKVMTIIIIIMVVERERERAILPLVIVRFGGQRAASGGTVHCQ